MIGISVANRKEWKATLEYFHKESNDCTKYIYGEYFVVNINEKELMFYICGSKKTNSVAANQYMIDHFNFEKIIIAGTCAGIDTKYKTLDILIPEKAVQYDCTVREVEPLLKESFNITIDSEYVTKDCVIGTADKPVVMYEDYMILKNNNIALADNEAASIAYVCMKNNVECVIVKGISDFPVEEIKTDTENAFNDQYNTFVKNIPVIMNRIYDKFLPRIIR